MSAIYFQMVEQENIYEYFEAEKKCKYANCNCTLGKEYINVHFIIVLLPSRFEIFKRKRMSLKSHTKQICIVYGYKSAKWEKWETIIMGLFRWCQLGEES